MTQGQRPDSSHDPLEGVLRRTRASLAVESVLRAFWPLGSLLAATWAAVAFGLANVLARGPLLAVFALAIAAAAFLLYRGIMHLRWPSRADALDRVDDTLPGRPLSALRDRPALGAGDPGAQAVWAAHLARMRKRAAGARATWPAPRLASRDPWALRLLALVAVVAALVFAGGEGLRGLPAALMPGGMAQVASGPSFEGWAEPPAYTKRPTLYLPEIRDGQTVSVPVGTKITLRVYGDASGFDLTQTVADSGPVTFTEAAPGIAIAEFQVTRAGEVALRRGRSDLGRWVVAVEPDLPPTIGLASPLGATPKGETRLAYEAHDDHGITAARVEIALDLPDVDRRYGLTVDPVPRAPLIADLPMPMSGNTVEVIETLVEDFSQSPYAGLPVTLSLTAEDGLRQQGHAGPLKAVLPARSFYDPLAAALVEQRRDLLWSPENARRVTQVLRAVTNRPEGIFETPRAYLVTRAAMRDLAAADKTGAVPPVVIDEVAAGLWQAAVLIEDDDLGDAAARLERAKQRLSEALRNDASDAEIAQLMDELRQATQDYMREMAKDAIQRGGQQQAETQPSQTVTQDQLQELMDRIQELSEQGRKAEAEQLLGMLQQMLENMQMTMGQGGEGQGQGQGGPGQKAMQGLADTLRQQQDLADKSFEQLQREFREGSNGQPGSPDEGRPEGQGAQPGQKPGEGADPDASELARRQDALRTLLDDMQGALPGEAGEAAREAMREAERNMAEARDRLREGDTSGALDRQADAIDQLRDGMRAMSEDMRRAQGGEGEGKKAGEAQAEGGDDPLGRPLGARGQDGSGAQMVPDADSAARARGILDEIRRRASEQARPPLELEYLRRLLDQF